jgi:hypothetical protein
MERYEFTGSALSGMLPRLSQILSDEFLVDLEHFITVGIYLHANPVHVWMSEHFKTGEVFDQSSVNRIVQGFVHPEYVGVADGQYDGSLIFFSKIDQLAMQPHHAGSNQRTDGTDLPND